MATYYVDGSASPGGNGSAGSPWKTIAAAVAGVNGGDTVRIKAGKYSESVSLSTPSKHSNTTWMADNPSNRPMIDGGYSIAAQTGSGNNVSLPASPTGGGGALFGIKEGVVNVTLDGLIIQNSPGAGLACNGHNATIKNCVIYFCFWNGLMVNPAGSGRVNGLTVQNTRILKTSVRYLYDRDQGSAGVILRELHEPVLFQDVEVAYGHGEGIDIDKPSSGTETQKFVFERMRVHDCNHTTLYVNQARYVIWRDSVCYYSHQGADIHGGGTGERGYTLRIKDENADYPNNKAGFLDIYNNLFINGGGLCIIGGGGRATATRAVYIGANTFVGGNWTKNNIPIKFEAEGALRNEGMFENNIIDLTAASGYNTDVGRMIGNNTFLVRNNLWSHQPHTSFRSGDSLYTTPRLVNPGAVISTSNYFTAAMDSFEKVTTTDNFNANNYKLQSNSPAIGAGSTGGSATNTNPATHVPARARQVDRAGTNRGAVPDIGAYEYQAGGGTPPDPPTLVASFTRTPAAGNPPLTVQYTDTSSATGGASITSRLWEFGDGTTSTATNPSKVYSAAGTYTTKLTITDSVNGLSSTFTGGTVTVETVVGGSVTARYTRSPAAAEVGDTITFTDTSLEEGDAVIDSWNYDFRDDTSSTSQNPTKIYATAGTRRVRLTVRDTVRGYSHTWTGPETVISDTPVADAIEASFTQSATSGQAPLSVTFTDTSQEIGAATIDSWAWDFGDGQTSTAASPIHVYTSPGAYIPVLTVEDTVNELISVYVGQTITVTTEEPPAAGGDVVLRQVRTALSTSDGEQTFSQAGLGGLTPKRARFVVTAATADGTAADGEMLCVGATAGGNQWAACIAAQHGVADTNAARMWTDDACILLIDGSGNELARATFVAWEADGVTVDVTWTGTPAAYLVTVEFGAGTEYETWVGTAAVGTTGSTTTPSAGFAADVVRAVATWGSRETAAADATLSLGMAHRLGGTYCLERYYADGLADANNRTRLNSGEIAHCRYNGGGRASVGIGLWSADGFTLAVADNNINSTVLLLAEKFGTVGSRVALVDSATATGNTDYTLDWDPQYVEHLISPRQGEGSSNDNALSGTIGLHTVTDDGEFSNEVSGENGSATTNEQSLSDNQFIVVGHTGTTLAAGATTLGTAKYTINYSTAPGTAQKYPSLAVEEGQASGGGGDYVTAEFTADVVSGQVPLRVQFFDLSSATNTITSWLWDFGDGRTSTAKNPAHVYREEGPFTVSLVVSDGTISDTEEKADYIATTVRTARKGIIGPYFLRVITSETTAATHSDPDDEENAGYMDGELGQNVIRINADPETPAAEAGDWIIYADAASGDLKVVFPDGTVGTVTVA